MKVFFGAAIQGVSDWSSRAAVHHALLDAITGAGYEPVCEHTKGLTNAESRALLECKLGPLPIDDYERRVMVRDAMIAGVESDIAAAIFEVSVPSLGTGVEFAHAYLRPRMGLREIPILALYQKDYWPNQLSTMVRGLSVAQYPNVSMDDYLDTPDAVLRVQQFLANVRKVIH